MKDIITDGNERIHTAANVSTVISALRGTTSVTQVIWTLPTVVRCSLARLGTKVTLVSEQEKLGFSCSKHNRGL